MSRAGFLEMEGGGGAEEAVEQEVDVEVEVGQEWCVYRVK